jgi:hypothetical protein
MLGSTCRVAIDRFLTALASGSFDCNYKGGKGCVTRNGLTIVIPKPGSSARNLLAAGSETADSSRDKAALQNDSAFESVFELTHY